MTMPDTRSGGREGAAFGDEQALPGSGSAGEAGAGSENGAREQIRQARDKVVDQAKSTLRDARDRAGSGLNEGRRRAAEQIGGIGGAFHRTSEQLRNEDQAKFADVADTVGRQIDRVADYLRDADGRTMARDIENLARRQPALVFAGAFALGVVAARFLKSSEPEYDSDDVGYGRIQPGGQPAGLGSNFDPGVGGFDAPA
ncbi:MAG: hypothetical protein H0X69_01535 [Gemmatimonadales bacterium]|nr:hypothetical protein [Gemmatimonadales bacterium]